MLTRNLGSSPRSGARAITLGCLHAKIAQLVEQPPRKQHVAGSSPAFSIKTTSNLDRSYYLEWKPIGDRLGFENQRSEKSPEGRDLSIPLLRGWRNGRRSRLKIYHP